MVALDIKPIDVAPKDMKFAEARDFTMEEVCRLFAVPPHLIRPISNSASVEMMYASALPFPKYL